MEQAPINAGYEFSYPHLINIARKHAAPGEIAIVGLSGYCEKEES